MRAQTRRDDRIVFAIFSVLKISCGLLMGFLYWTYYEGVGDTIYFHEQAQVLFNFFQTDRISFSEWVGIAPLSLTHADFSAQAEPRTFFFVRFLSMLTAFTQGNYLIMSAYVSFFSALATWGFARELVRSTSDNKLVIYVAILFVPSITFWSSGLLKESLMTTAIYVLGIVIIRWLKKRQKWWYFIPTILSIYVLWKVKYYVPITLMPVLILTLVFYRARFLRRFSFSKKLILYFALLIIGGFGIAFIHPVFNSGRFFELVRISHDAIVVNSTDAIIHFQNAENDVWFFIKNLPISWFTGIFRPFIWESFSVFSLLWAIEKTFFSLAVISAIIISRKLIFNKAELWWGIAILIYGSVLSAVITIATPNFGSLIRYEVAYMPFLWLLVLTVLNKYRNKNTV
ncbi:hypothetical protein [Marivirga sericea]|nr:hypothetical protein [Marivirga sericea]